MSYNFTDKDVLSKVIEIGNQFPDYIYDPLVEDAGGVCRYTTGADGQGCIVGQALRALGVPYAVLAEYDQGVGLFASSVLASLLDENPNTDIGKRLNAIQSSQDHGLPWGQCVR